MPIDPKKITALRHKRNLTQAGAAKRAGMAQSNWARIENGERTNPTIDIAQRIAAALGCKVDTLLSK